MLITLVIIGVIAAITVPTLIQNHKRQEATDRLLKFYSTINQVILKAKADGNNWEYWAESASGDTDNSSETVKYFAETYLLPYLVYHKYGTNNMFATIYLNDGSSFSIMKGSCIDFVFDINGNRKPNVEGRDKFRYLYCPKSGSMWGKSGDKIAPYKSKLIKTREQALQKCRQDKSYCTALLSFDDWEFKEDYPYHI